MLPVQTAKSSCKLPKDASLAGSTTKKKEKKLRWQGFQNKNSNK
jgi:hypothetical protein